MIEVLRAGRMNSVQDMGRNGFRHLGICQSGALDRIALAITNKLVGNAVDAAALEMTLGPITLKFTVDTRIAVGGADFAATLDGKSVALWWSVPVRAGQILKLDAARNGMRAYVAVAGGIDVAIQLGSRATDMSAGFGGHDGRALAVGDRLTMAARSPASEAISCALRFGVRGPVWYSEDVQASGTRPMPIRVIPGPEYAHYPVAAQRGFWGSVWTLTPQSNRMGFRLSGPELKIKKNVDMLSHGVFPGVIQVPPAGQPIILMADAQTTGGYPKIGVVIAADISKLAQLRFNRTLQFVECSVEQARQELINETLYLEQIDRAITWRHPVKK